MKRQYIKWVLILGSIALLTSCGCANCECEVATKTDSVPAVIYNGDPTNPSGPYDSTLTWEDLELEGEFQDDTIGQPKEQH